MVVLILESGAVKKINEVPLSNNVIIGSLKDMSYILDQIADSSKFHPK